MKFHAGSRIATQQADATLNQAAPVQNTWYRILDAINARLLAVRFLVTVTNEDLEYRIVIDDIQYLVQQAGAVAATPYFPIININSANRASGTTVQYEAQRSFLIEGRHIVIDMRKTTNAGAGNLQSTVNYQRLM